MAAYEAAGESDEWYTPFYVFEALGCWFDLDVASPPSQTCVPADRFLTKDGLTAPWSGFVWMNPPFGHQSTKRKWLTRFFDHGNGIALTPDRTSAPWFREAWWRADAHLFTPKIKFYRPDGTRGESPGTGSVLWASGDRAKSALAQAAGKGLGIMGTALQDRPLDAIIRQPQDSNFEADRARLEVWRNLPRVRAA